MNFLADLLSMGKSSHAYYRQVKVTGPLSSGKLAPRGPKSHLSEEQENGKNLEAVAKSFGEKPLNQSMRLSKEDNLCRYPLIKN